MESRNDQPRQSNGSGSCNIGARGRVVRLVGGLLMLAVGLAMTVGLGVGVFAGVGGWVMAVILLAGGAFQVYEGWAGWCVLRAMGVRTPW